MSVYELMPPVSFSLLLVTKLQSVKIRCEKSGAITSDQSREVVMIGIHTID